MTDSARGRELATKLRLYARDDVRSMQRDRMVVPDIVDTGDLGRWADLMEEAAELLDKLSEAVEPLVSYDNFGPNLT